MSANPASGPRKFRFTLPQAERVRVAVYDVSGWCVATLADGEYAAGVHDLTWNPASTAAAPAAGVCFVSLSAGDRTIGKRVVLLRAN